jgi:hypothetical protein
MRSCEGSREGRGGLEGVSAEASANRVSKSMVAPALLGVEGRSAAGTMSYDVSCLNFASAKTMRSGNSGNTCRPPCRSKLREGIKRHYADPRSAPSAGGH